MDAKGYSPTRLASAIGSTAQHIRKICKGDEPLGTFFNAAAAFVLDVHPTRLLMGNRLPIRPDLKGAINHFTLDDAENPAKRKAILDLLEIELAESSRSDE